MAELSEGLTEAERDDLCDAIMGYQHTTTGAAPRRFDKHIVPAVESIIAARLAPIEALAEDPKYDDIVAVRGEWRVIGVNTAFQWVNIKHSLSGAVVNLPWSALAAPRPVHPAGDEGRQG